MSESRVEPQDLGPDRPRNQVFSAPADDPRARRPIDLVALVVGLLVTLLAAWAHASGTDLDNRVLEYFGDGLPGWLSAVATVFFVVGGLFPLGLLISIWLFGQGRGAIARDMVLAAAAALGIATAASVLTGPEWPDILPELIERSGSPSFPIIRLAVSVAILRVANPYLSVPMRTLSRRLLVPMAGSAIVLSYGTISAVIGGYAAGVTAAALVHLVFGSGVGIPSLARIAAALRSADVVEDSLAYLDEQPVGATLLRGRTSDGTDLMVKVYGRDASDAAVASRVWRWIWYRDNDRALTTSSLQLVEHESLMLLEAARSGVPAPALVTWGHGDAGDSVLVTEWLDSDRLASRSASTISASDLDGCWMTLLELHQSEIALRAMSGRNVVLAPDGVVFDDFSSASISPDATTTSIDVAQLLVSTALGVGNEAAIDAALRNLPTDSLLAALEVLQPGALSSELNRDLKDGNLKLKTLRSDLANRLQVDPPDLVQLVRVTWGNVAMVALTFFAASSLIGSLADIGLDTIADQLADARWGWLVTALIVAQLTNVAEWVSLSGMVLRPVPFGPTIMFRYAISFISLAVPSDAGAIAMNIRYMQRLGVSAAAAVAQGPLLTVISKSFDVLLLIATSRIIGQTVDLDDVDSGPVLRLLVLAVVLVVIGLAVMLAVPKYRKQVVPPIRDALSAIREPMTDPERVLRILGGSLAQRLLFALALSASVSAFGGSVTFSEAIFVNSAVSLFVGLVPVPGGIGVGEAALTAGLSAVGVPESAALAAAISHRMVTSYLPPVYGWYTTRWLTAHDYL